jgi:hypothetical protein
VSRRLDLENTRKLENGEEPVGCEEGSMVWDLVNAKFAIFEEVQTPESGVEPYQTHSEGAGKAWLVGVSTSGAEIDAKKVQASVLERVKTDVKGEKKIYSSLYRHAGKEGQPHMHPEIERDVVGGGEWLIFVLVVGDGLKEGDVQSVVSEWAKAVDVKYGVWEETMDMS